MSEEGDGNSEFNLLVEKIGKVGEMVSTVKDDTETAVKKAISEQTDSIEKRFTDMEARLDAVEKADGDGKKKKKDMDYEDDDYEEGDGKKKNGMKKKDDGVTKALAEIQEDIKKLKAVPLYKGTADGQDINKRQREDKVTVPKIDFVRYGITGRIDA